MRNIRIIRFHKKVLDYDDFSRELISLLPDNGNWMSVTQEDFDLLYRYLPRDEYLIIEEVAMPEIVISLEDFRKLAIKEENRRQKAKLDSEKREAERLAKKRVKAEEKKLLKEKEILEVARKLGYKVTK